MNGNRKYEIIQWIFMVLCCAMGMMSNGMILPVSNIVTGIMRTPGGIETGFSLMFLTVGAWFVEIPYAATIMGIVQGLMAICLGMTGSMGLLVPIGYIIPGIAIDICYFILKKHNDGLLRSVSVVNGIAAVTAAVFKNAVTYRITGSIFVLYLCVAFSGGIIFGLLGMALIKALRPIIIFEKSNDSEYLVEKFFSEIFPVQFFLVAVAAVNAIIDNLIASNVIGAQAVAGVALFSPVSCFINGLAGLFAIGAGVVIINNFGKSRKDLANSVYTLVLLVLFLISLLFMAILLLCPAIVAGVVGGAGNEYLLDYIKGFGIVIIAAFFSSAFMVLLQVTGDTKRAAKSILVMAMVNVAADLCFVVVLRLGTFGLGFATSISYLVQLIILIPPFIGRDCPLKFNIKSLKLELLPEVIREGLPSALVNITLVFRALAINFSLLTQGGKMAIAAGAVENVVSWMLRAILVGAGQTAIMIMSLYASEEDRVSFKNTFTVVVKKTLAIAVIVVLVVACFAEQISAAFFDAGTVEYGYAISCLRIIPYFVIPGIFLRVLAGANQALKRIKVSLCFSVLENVAMAVIVIILAKIMGVVGVFTGILVSEFAVLLIFLIYSWIKCRKVTFSFEELTRMTKVIGVDKKYRLEKTLYNVEEAIGMSKDICDFCKGLGIDAKRTMISGLAIEEISVLLFKYSLADIKNAQVDVRVILKNNELVIRFRDNGKMLFNGDKIDIEDKNDKTANIGIRMLVKMASDITANSIMGLNVITIKMLL